MIPSSAHSSHPLQHPIYPFTHTHTHTKEKKMPVSSSSATLLWTCLRQQSSHFRPPHLPVSLRCLATATPEPAVPSSRNPPAPQVRKPTSFTDKLNKGPSFADFVSGGAKDGPLSLSESLEVALDETGNGSGKEEYPVTGRVKKREHVRLPDWLKTEIPVSAGYNRIKDDLRGLGLHTGLPIPDRHIHCTY